MTRWEYLSEIIEDIKEKWYKLGEHYADCNLGTG